MANDRNTPIGIMDSGIGGLTIAKALRETLPSEAIYYFGDTAHLPYGDKSSTAIESYSLQIAQFLFDQGCKLLVIACNSASASAYETLANKWGTDRVINVIDPVVDYISTINPEKVGVIGTKRTISSGTYKRKLLQRGISKVSSLPTPLLASMIEEGFVNNDISHLLISNYLSHESLMQVDVLLLACTHYPLIKKEIEAFMPSNCTIIDSTDSVSKVVKANLMSRNLQCDENLNSRIKDQFWVSDYTQSFEKTAQLFFGDRIELREQRLG